MTIYITVEQVDALLGPTWAPDDQKAKAALMANTWLTNLGLPEFDPVPGDVIQAGAEIAREASAGNIYGSKETCLLYTSDAADDTPCVDLGGVDEVTHLGLPSVARAEAPVYGVRRSGG